MSRQSIIRIAFVAMLIQLPIWLQERSRKIYFAQLTADAKSLVKSVPKSPEANENSPTVEWSALRELDAMTKRPAEGVKAFNNKKVTVSGYMVPLEDKQQKVTEFLLVPSPMSCIHVPAPPPNQVVYVIAGEEKNVSVTLGAIQVSGTFFVASNTTPNVTTLYTMEADSVVPLK